MKLYKWPVSNIIQHPKHTKSFRTKTTTNHASKCVLSKKKTLKSPQSPKIQINNQKTLKTTVALG
jgi:hypothetical protein